MSIFKAYDIRGVYPTELDERIAYRIGGALVKLLGARTLVVGRDMRRSAPAVQRAVIDGICAQGCDVLDIGLVSTPMAYFGIGFLKADGGLSTTASHNPPQYIGAKLCRRGAVPMSADTGIRDIQRLVEGDELPAAPRQGTVKSVDVRADYRRHLQEFAHSFKGLEVVIDTANGMGGLEVPLVLEGTDLKWHGMYLELDGSFPNHEANPLKDENVAALREEVLRRGAAAGFAFDGDADRCCVLDERGERIGADLVTALLAREILERHPGATIVYDLRSSHVLPEEIRRLGGVPRRERVGHSFIKATMRELESPFAGELSGHFYFRDHYYSDCATLAMISLLNLMAREKKPLSELVAPLHRYHSTGEINFHVEDPDATIAELRRRYREGEQDELDGITVVLPGFWFNVRKSNTEPLVRLRLEAGDAETLARRQAELCEILGTPAS